MVAICHPFCKYLNSRRRPRTFSPRWRGRHHGPTDTSNAVIDCAGMRLYVVVTSEVERLAHRANVLFRKQRANIGLKARWVGHTPSQLGILQTVLQLHHRFGPTTMPYCTVGPDPRAGFTFIECTSVRQSRFFGDPQSVTALNRSPTPARGRGANPGRSDLLDPTVRQRPFMPRKVGMPLSAVTPAPARMKTPSLGEMASMVERSSQILKMNR